MSDSFKIQQNVKVGNDLINLRADTPDEFQGIANWVIENAALLVNVQTALNAVPPALAGNVTHTQVVQEQQYQQPTLCTRRLRTSMRLVSRMMHIPNAHYVQTEHPTS